MRGRLSRYSIRSSRLSFSAVAVGNWSRAVFCIIRAVSSSENSSFSSIHWRKSLFSGQALWQWRHPTRQLCQELSIHSGNGIFPALSLWKTMQRSARRRKRSEGIAPVGQFKRHAWHFWHFSIIFTSCQLSFLQGRSE